jgi:molecular chaperone GrpE
MAKGTNKQADPAVEEVLEPDEVIEASDEEGQAQADAGDDSSLQAALDAANAKAAEHLEQLLRAKAETENVRRRAERDLENAHKYALDRFAQELLPVVDSMEMGVSVASGEIDPASLREGVELTHRMMLSALQKFGVTIIDPQGEKFNPEWHQAMTMQPAPDVEPNTVINVFQKGYQLNDRLIRTAMVVVSAPAPDQAPKIDEHA